ncbi:PLDc N-terminal domain-containing protein [Arthrobacter sp. MSA 4-2]|uniref:PLDc N-terminal domain-containing protein n=1 Tax=Arthrobacter sp. MSA 4-2 TaxID=2794349 RepID=UPI0018E7C725|nr:PLDc N-terminal domain-containing protein [Arthrobacter sp. MSA 4-2]MBJ2121636.1 PLDc N-terminal domain-containing protein [Arthrobacter sp. MSA 4-2]
MRRSARGRAARKKSWKDLDRDQRRAVMVLGTVQATLMAAALADLARRPAAAVRGRRAAWAAACFLNFAGPIAYFLFGRRHPAAPR